MLPSNKLFIVWVLDDLGLCKDVIKWEILGWLVDYERIFVENFGVNWRGNWGGNLGECFGVKWEGNLGECFSLCCRYGYLDGVKWLWEISNGKIDIYAKNEPVFDESSHLNECFVWCCRYGYLNVAKWLWEVSKGSIDIHAENEHIFRERVVWVVI